MAEKDGGDKISGNRLVLCKTGSQGRVGLFTKGRKFVCHSIGKGSLAPQFSLEKPHKISAAIRLPSLPLPQFESRAYDNSPAGKGIAAFCKETHPALPARFAEH